MPLFHNEVTITPFKRRDPQRMGGQEAIIYSCDDYRELLAQRLLDQWDDDDDIKTRTIRFSLGINFKLRFGKEGRPSPTVPAHEKLTGVWSLIAGNQGFNEENEICVITNKSSDYCPDANSLQYALIVMIYENKFVFAKNLIIRIYAKNQQSKRIEITSEELIKELQELNFYKNYHTIVASMTADFTSRYASTTSLLNDKGTYAEMPSASPVPNKKRERSTPSPKTEKPSDHKEGTPTKSGKRIFTLGSKINPLSLHAMLVSIGPAATPEVSTPASISSSSSSFSSEISGGLSQSNFFHTMFPQPSLQAPILPPPLSQFHSRPSLFSGDTSLPPITSLDIGGLPKPNFGP
jgi:hypothetical protein